MGKGLELQNRKLYFWIGLPFRFSEIFLKNFKTSYENPKEFVLYEFFSLNPKTDRQTDKTDRQDRQDRQGKTHRHTDTQTHRHTDTRTHRHTDTQTHRHTDTRTQGGTRLLI